MIGTNYLLPNGAEAALILFLATALVACAQSPAVSEPPLALNAGEAGPGRNEAIIRYYTGFKEGQDEPLLFSTAVTNHGGTFPRVLEIDADNFQGEWRSSIGLPPAIAGNQSGMNLYIHVPCEPHDEAAFSNAARYIHDAKDRRVFKSQYRYNLLAGRYLLNAHVADDECSVSFYRVSDYTDTSTWELLSPEPVDFDEHFICTLSGPGC